MDRAFVRRFGLIGLFLAAFLLALVAPSQAHAAGQELNEVQITDFNVQREGGATSEEPFQYADTVTATIDWDASSYGAGISAGDYFDVTLPEGLYVPDGASTSFNVYDGENLVGTAQVTGSTVRVTFTDYVQSHANVKGTLTVSLRFLYGQMTFNQPVTLTVSTGYSSKSQTITVEGPTGLPSDEVLGKSASEGSDANHVSWTLRINFAQHDLTDAVVSDSLEGTGEKFVPGTFRLQKGTFDSAGQFTPDPGSTEQDISSAVVLGDGDQTFSYTLGDVGTSEYQLTYQSTYTTGTTLKNSAVLNANGRSTTAFNTWRLGASGGVATGDPVHSVKLTKVDANDPSKLLSGAVFRVTEPGGTTFDLTTGEDGTATSELLPAGTYTVQEVQAPDGYQLNDQVYTVEVTDDADGEQTVTDEPTPATPPVVQNDEPTPKTDETTEAAPAEPEDEAQPEVEEQQGSYMPATGDYALVALAAVVALATLLGAVVMRARRLNRR